MPKFNPNESVEVVETLTELWNEFWSLTGTLHGFTFINDGELPSGYYFYGSGNVDDNGRGAFQMLYAQNGNAAIGALRHTLQDVRKDIADAEGTCQLMLASEYTKWKEEGDKMAKQRLDNVYMPALNLTTYDEVERKVAITALAAMMGGLMG